MNIKQRLGMWMAGIEPQQLLPPTPSAPVVIPAKRQGMVSAAWGSLIAAATPEAKRVYQAPRLPSGVKPTTSNLAMDGKPVMALDYAPAYAYANLGNGYAYGGFIGYPALAELAQVAEYRVITQVPAKEMLRKGWKLTYKGDASPDAGDKLGELDDELRRLKVNDLLRHAVVVDGFFGRAHIYIDVKSDSDNPTALKKPLVLNPMTIPKGSLNGFKVIEPMWTYPQMFNANNPLKPDFYIPQSWFVMGTEIHRSRLLEFCSEPLSDIFKPSYNFGGMSRSQLALPYVNNWLSVRGHVTRAIGNFSTSGIKTNLGTILQGQSDPGLAQRMKAYTTMRDNMGLLVLDVNSAEEFFQINTPLSGLDALQLQSLQQLAVVAHIPVVKLLGVQVAGLGADSSGEIQVFYDYIHGRQRDELDDPFSIMMKLAQLNIWGEIDPGVGFMWQPLEEANEKDLADVRKSEGDRATAYINAGVISPEEERQRLSDDPQSGYNFIDPADVPDPPPMLAMGAAGPGGEGDGDDPPAKDAAPKVGELVRNGKTIYYVDIGGGSTKEFATEESAQHFVDNMTNDSEIEERDGYYWVNGKKFSSRSDAEWELATGGIRGTGSTSEFERTSRF